jgi:hypothetical protein
MASPVRRPRTDNGPSSEFPNPRELLQNAHVPALSGDAHGAPCGVQRDHGHEASGHRCGYGREIPAGSRGHGDARAGVGARGHGDAAAHDYGSSPRSHGHGGCAHGRGYVHGNGHARGSAHRLLSLSYLPQRQFLTVTVLPGLPLQSRVLNKTAGTKLHSIGMMGDWNYGRMGRSRVAASGKRRRCAINPD